MARLEILEFPDPRLRTVAKPVGVVDDRIRTLCDDMLETMYDAKGIGLAATQVNIHERVVVMDLSEERDRPQFFINPEIEPYGEFVEGEEGCLSVPGYYDAVTRAERVRIKALDREGNPSRSTPRVCSPCAFSTSAITSPGRSSSIISHRSSAPESGSG